MHKNRGKDRYADRDKQENLGDKQREERTGIGKPQRQREISEAWHASDSGPSFIKALEERAYYVARGDRCAYAVVDLYGEVVNLAKQIDGVKTKDSKPASATEKARRHRHRAGARASGAAGPAEKSAARKPHGGELRRHRRSAATLGSGARRAARKA